MSIFRSKMRVWQQSRILAKYAFLETLVEIWSPLKHNFRSWKDEILHELDKSCANDFITIAKPIDREESFAMITHPQTSQQNI